MRVVLLDCNRPEDWGSTLLSPPRRTLKLTATHWCQTGDVLLGGGRNGLAAAGRCRTHSCRRGELGLPSWSSFMFCLMLG